MKKPINILACLLLVLWSTNLLAHRPSESHTKIQLEKGKLTALLELPWSIAEALKKDHPTLEAGASRQAFMQGLHSYVERNFEITYQKEKLLLEGFEHLAGEHEHSAVLELTYSVDQLEGVHIRNTLMFNLNARQKNYHKVFLATGEELQFTTKVNAADFVVVEGKGKVGRSSTLGWIALAFGFLIIISPVWYPA